MNEAETLKKHGEVNETIPQTNWSASFYLIFKLID